MRYAPNKVVPRWGERFGRLLVLGEGEPYISPKGKKETTALTVCECGNITTKMYKYLRKGLTTSCGRHERGNPRQEVPGYNAMHQRIKKAKGPASEYICVDCGDPATAWSYDHKDGGQYWQVIPGCTEPVPYSIHMEHYQPRCASCHVRLDAHDAEARRLA